MHACKKKSFPDSSSHVKPGEQREGGRCWHQVGQIHWRRSYLKTPDASSSLSPCQMVTTAAIPGAPVVAVWASRVTMAACWGVGTQATAPPRAPPTAGFTLTTDWWAEVLHGGASAGHDIGGTLRDQTRLTSTRPQYLTDSSSAQLISQLVFLERGMDGFDTDR